jgi:hypothetical protein
MFENLTWTCYVCGDERPEDKISVYKKPLILLGQEHGTENIRYCHDRPMCVEAAPSKGLLSLQPDSRLLEEEI